MSLESRLKSAVNALEKPFKGIIPENLMPEHSKWEPDESSEDDPTPSPEPSLPDQDPEPSEYAAINRNNLKKVEIAGMQGAHVEVVAPDYPDDDKPMVVSTGTIDVLSEGKYWFRDNNVASDSMPQVGERVTFTVTKEGYKDWSITILVEE